MTKKKFKVREIKSHVITWMLALTAVLLLLIFLKHVIENNYVPRQSASTPKIISVNPPLPPEVPRGKSASIANGSFTELFSGTGWMNSEKTNVYQDQTLSSISFPPDYEWQEIPELSNNLKDETIIAANGNGKEIVLVAKSGKIMSLRGAAGDEAISINQSSIIPAHRSLGEGGNNQLNNAVLDYDDAKQVWVVAASSDTASLIGPISRISPIGQIGPISEIACAGGECLVLVGSDIYRFAENDPSSAVILPFPKGVPAGGGIYSVSVGKAGSTLLVGAVEKNGSTSFDTAQDKSLTTGGGQYTGNIYKYSSLASPESSLARRSFSEVGAKAGGSFQSLMINDQSQSSVINNQSLFSSPYPGVIRFGYDSENAQILALYAAYIGQAKLFQSSIINNQSAEVELPLEVQLPNINSSSPSDFSRFFPQRVMDGNFAPKIFSAEGGSASGGKHGNAWWLSSEISQFMVSGVEPASTKFIRIEGGAGVDFADILKSSQQLVVSGVEPAFELLPGFKPNELYALAANQGGAKIYKFIDKGYKKDKKIVWESLRLNRFDNEIVSGRFYKIQGSTNGGGESAINSPFSKGSTPQGGGIYFYLSNNGGKTWQETKLNEMVNFPQNGSTSLTVKGNDFRFKAELYPGTDKFQTPWLNLVSVEYYSKP